MELLNECEFCKNYRLSLVDACKVGEVVRNEFHYVFCPYTFPIVEEIKEAMSDLKFKIWDFRYEFDIKKDFEPIFVEVFGRQYAEHCLYGNWLNASTKYSFRANYLKSC